MSVIDSLVRRLRGTLTRPPHQRTSRALVKTLLYRVVMIAITILVAYGFTGEVGEAFGIGLVANLVKTGTYYGYERIWDRIEWGLLD